jgi:NADP-dependent 3-hydroxy acid dehydrogenase YdfG
MNQMDRVRSAMPVTQKSRWHPQTIDLAGARVMITGATSGIGKACAFRFQELGCHLILIGQNEEALQSLGVELAQESDHQNHPEEEKLHEYIRLDVRNVDLIHQLADHVGHIDILINNAGVNLGSETADMLKSDNMEKMVSTNYLAPMAFVSAFAPMMKQKGSGHIINICSTAAHDIYPNSSVYCSTKAALAAYTTAARHDLVDTPIRVTSISPGLVDTPLHEKKLGGVDQSRKVFDGIIPLYPGDIADQIIYVSTRARHVQIGDISSYATNQSHSSCKGIPGVARLGPSMGGRMESTPQDFSSSGDRYESPNKNLYESPSKNFYPTSRNDVPPHMENNGAMRQGFFNADRDRNDWNNMKSGANRNDTPSYVPSWGAGGHSNSVTRMGGREPPSPFSGGREPPSPVNSRPNTGNTPYLDRGPDRPQTPKENSVRDFMHNNDSSMGMMPGQMPPELPGQFPSENSYRHPASPNNDRGRYSYEQSQQSQFGTTYPGPSDEYNRIRSQQSGSNFEGRRPAF